MGSEIEAYLDLFAGTELAGWAERIPRPTDAGDLLADLFDQVFGTVGLPLRQGRPPYPGLEPALGEAGLRRLFPSWPGARVLSLSAGTLGVFDFWEAGHEAAQEAERIGERVFAPYWHGVAHRREPDAGNAAYWFRRVGNAPIHAELAARAAADPGAAGLLRNGRWDSFAMIDLCVGARPGSDAERLGSKYQELEIRLLAGAALREFGAR